MQVVNMINMLTLDPRYPPKIVGSYKYAIHEYPNDIDLFEYYQGCCGFEEVRAKVIQRFKDIIRDIDQSDLTYLGDFKAGMDKRFDINIGKMHGSRIFGYHPDQIRDDIRKLFDDKLLTDDEVTLWLRHVVNEPSVDEYIDLRDLVHDKCVVRWTPQDVEKGYKQLPQNKLLSFEEALSQQSIVKIDIWTNISGRYTEITNWYAITYLTEGSSTPKYLSSPIENYELSLKRDLEYYKNPSLHKSMKYAKRLWNYYVLKKMKNEMIVLYPLFSSGSAKMYQIMGEIEVITSVLKHVKNIQMESIKANIEDWKTRLGTLLFDDLPTHTANKVFEKINTALSTKSKSSLIILISEIKDILEIAVDKSVKKFFKRNNIVQV
jgi:hypothetical protein